MKQLAYRLLTGILFLWAAFSCNLSVAQEAPAGKYFIYIQHDSGTPFYVKKDNELLSSTHAGYIIIPQLKRGDYQLTLGLPGNRVPEASFEVSLTGKGDRGFLLKEADKKLQLFALDDLSAVKPVAIASAAGNRIIDVPGAPAESGHAGDGAETKRGEEPLVAGLDEDHAAPPAEQPDKGPDTSDFAHMLNEITEKNTPVPATAVVPAPKEEEGPGGKETALPDSGQIETAVTKEPDSSGANRPEPSSGSPFERLAARLTGAAEKPSSAELPPATPNPTKRAGRTPPESDSELSFISFPDTQKETGKPAPAENNVAAREEKDGGLEREASQAKKEPEALPKDVEPGAAIYPAGEPAENTAGGEPGEKKAAATAGIPNSDCQKLADENQFQKVRRKMASRTDDEGIFHIAQKFLKDDICYSSEQVKSLTYLFVSDEYRYRFLEQAYPHVYDTVHFPDLVKTLSTGYYQGRFNALVGR